jgi:hypothetical protein
VRAVPAGAEATHASTAPPPAGARAWLVTPRARVRGLAPSRLTSSRPPLRQAVSTVPDESTATRGDAAKAAAHPEAPHVRLGARRRAQQRDRAAAPAALLGPRGHHAAGGRHRRLRLADRRQPARGGRDHPRGACRAPPQHPHRPAVRGDEHRGALRADRGRHLAGGRVAEDDGVAEAQRPGRGRGGAGEQREEDERDEERRATDHVVLNAGARRTLRWPPPPAGPGARDVASGGAAADGV